jgi:signal transduction histidine kinase
MHLQLVTDLLRSPDPDRLLHTLAGSLARELPLRHAARIERGTRVMQEAWPSTFEVGSELVATAARATSPMILRLATRFPDDAERLGDGDALALPLRDEEGDDHGTALLIADRGAFGSDAEGWAPLGRAFAGVRTLARQAREAEDECLTLRRSVEETEALHTLGLGVHRSLDPEELFPLVARLTRTLLSAHYVVVHCTDGEGHLHPVATLGLQDEDRFREGDEAAVRALAGGHPAVLGGRNEPPPVWEGHGSEGAHTVVIAPLVLFGEPVGALVAGYRRPHRSSDRDIRLLTALSTQVAVGISNARLHQALAERTGELERAYEELGRVSRMKERFFASINHELRTPLSAIMGYHTLLLDGTVGELPEGAVRYVKNANRAASSLLALVNDILDLSKLTAGRMTVVPEMLSVGDAVREVLETVRPLAEQKELEIYAEVPEGLPLLEADPNRLRQIMVNLAANAIKFTQAGSVRLEAALAGDGSDGVELRVHDTGPGIAAESLDRIFEEFEQATEADAQRGTGLGLPISRRLARIMGGALWAESAPGKGSTFILRLPIRPPPSAESASSERARPAAAHEAG